MKKSDLLWSLYLSEREFIRHHEEQRTAASNILAAIAAGLIVALGTEQLSRLSEIAVSGALILMGLFGMIFCGKLSELIKLHSKRSYAYLGELDKEIAAVEINAMRASVKEDHKKAYPYFSGKRLSHIWVGFHAAILLAGVGFLGIYLLNLIR